MWDPGWALEQQVAVTGMFLQHAGNCPRRSCAATAPGWDGKGLDVAAGGLQAAEAALAALQDAQCTCPQHEFLLMPRQAGLNKENPTKVLRIPQLGSPACACGRAGQALEQGRCRNALLGGEKSR